MKSKLNSPLKIFTDFDGTITKIDSLNMVLDEFAISEWRPIEDRVTAHQLSEKEALQAEFDLVKAPLEKVIDFLIKNVKIDSTFKPFAQWCKSQKIDLIVLSGGFEEFIDAIFNKFGINSLEVHSNSLSVYNNTWQVVQSELPKINNLCNHCKTHHLIESQRNGYKVVYIGDGNTDRCPAENADIIFAKDTLAEYLKNKNKEFFEYQNFNEIQNKLECIIQNTDAIDSRDGIV
jgi:2-hydroxy-3-keto-5-methylthiopentenyl-1-phosphate phosphatase